jgi:hypothetical protein
VHRITQHADAINADLNDIADNERADTSWSAGGDEVARIEGHHARDPTDEERDGIDHQGSAAGLTARAVDMRFDEDIGGIELSLDIRANRAKGIKAFGARELGVAFLNVASGNVVEAGVAKKMGESVVAIAQVGTAAADDEGEFAFVFDMLGITRKDDGLFGPDDSRWRFEKNKRLFRDFVAAFGGVGRIIASNANDLSRLDGREEPNIMGGPGVRAARPCGPWDTGNLANLLALDNTIERGVRVRACSSSGKKTAEFHSVSARAVIGVRSM